MAVEKLNLHQCPSIKPFSITKRYFSSSKKPICTDRLAQYRLAHGASNRPLRKKETAA
jgi:hypothetical protein